MHVEKNERRSQTAATVYRRVRLPREFRGRREREFLAAAEEAAVRVLAWRVE